ncbi:MAG: phosphate ABC transporter permease subunit PstC [Candidatus Methanospirareceae archaeon]
MSFLKDRDLKNRVARIFMLAITVFSCMIIIFMVVGLLWRSRPILATHRLSELLLSSTWLPMRGEFGFYPFIIGTFWVTLLAMLFSIPLCLLTAIYLTEYAPTRIRALVTPLIDLLAGIPSVVYGLWGILVLVPFIKYLAPFFGRSTSGYCLLTGGVVLAIMVFPIIIAVSAEVVKAIPQEIREVSLSLGATRWQTVKHVVLRAALPGLIAAVVLGFSRAFGETMAVLMVVGNVPILPSSVFEPAYPLPALIANNYGEMMSIPLYDSALLFAALILLLIVFIFSIGARLVLLRVEREVQ